MSKAASRILFRVHHQPAAAFLVVRASAALDANSEQHIRLNAATMMI